MTTCAISPEIVWTSKEPVKKEEPGKSGQAASQAATTSR